MLHIETKMKISFTDKVLEADHPVFIVSDKASKLISLGSSVDKEIVNILKEFIKNNKNSKLSIQNIILYKK